MATYKYQLDMDTLYHLNSTYRLGIYFQYLYLYSNSQQGKPCTHFDLSCLIFNHYMCLVGMAIAEGKIRGGKSILVGKLILNL